MPVRVMKPFNFDAKQHYPVIVSLHGAGALYNRANHPQAVRD
ncbi:hypothetical protein OAF42_01995 [Planctomicrobium sp.]|nr:hypothetical protein [Planctomicrobium sp.]MDA7504028.1 hypothetical protein [bacterium]MDB4733195.1 hypothetical protein [Planctomicrobium sp.]